MDPPPVEGLKWEELCKIMTGTIRRNGLFHWGEIRSVVSEDVYMQMQWLRGSDRLWVVDRNDVFPKPRTSMMDYATISRIGLYEKPRRRVLLKDPMRIQPRLTNPPNHPTCETVDVNISLHKLCHYVNSDTLNFVHDNFIRDLVLSFYDAVVHDVETEIYTKFLEIPDTSFAYVEENNKNHDCTTHTCMPLNHDMIGRASINITRQNPQVPFPHGLVCMAAPDPANRLFGQSIEHTEPGNIFGVDVIPSSALNHDPDPKKYLNMVTAKNSIHIGLSDLEITTICGSNGTSIVARYSVGVSIDPQMTAKIISCVR